MNNIKQDMKIDNKYYYVVIFCLWLVLIIKELDVLLRILLLQSYKMFLEIVKLKIIVC